MKRNRHQIPKFTKNHCLLDFIYLMHRYLLPLLLKWGRKLKESSYRQLYLYMSFVISLPHLQIDPLDLTLAPSKCTTTPECTFCIMQCSGRSAPSRPLQSSCPCLSCPQRPGPLRDRYPPAKAIPSADAPARPDERQQVLGRI